MASEDQDENTPCLVLMNAEEQYSIWPKHLEVPKGWSQVGFEGTREQCSAYVDRVWTDMRPLSLRKLMSH